MDLQETLEDAQKHLLSSFPGARPMRIIANTYLGSLTIKFFDRLKIIDGYLLPNEPVPAFEAASIVGRALYSMANPEIMRQSEPLLADMRKNLLADMLNQGTGFTRGYIVLQDIVATLSGFVYINVTEAADQSPFDEIQERIALNQAATADGSDRSNVFLCDPHQVRRVLNIAWALYQKVGHIVLSELALLPLDEARMRILSYTRQNIYDT